MTDARVTKVEEVLREEGFAAKLLEMENPADVQAAFAEKGVDFTIEEVVEIGNAIASGEATGEISEEDLDSVSGGGIIALVVANIVADVVLIAMGCDMANTKKKFKW